MKKLLIILVLANLAACNSGQNADGTTGASGSSDTSSAASNPNNSNSSGNEIGTASTSATSIDTSVTNFITQAVIGNAMEVEASEIAQKKSSNPDVQSFAGMMVTDHGKALNQLRLLAKKKRVELPMMADANRNWTAAEESASKTSSDAAEKYGSQSRPGQDVINNDKRRITAGSEGRSTGTRVKNSGKDQTTTTANSMHAAHQEKLNRLKQRVGADFDREYMKLMVEDHAKAIRLLQKGISNKDADVKAFAQQLLPTVRVHEASTKTLMHKLQAGK